MRSGLFTIIKNISQHVREINWEVVKAIRHRRRMQNDEQNAVTLRMVLGV
jgi:hypothetical protein